ncbi:hypothetical protein SELMODRAFT_408474 [Selaginella moellendorffii]|uniref:Aminoglycoside phosphotransferase domain-containing protein n=1 Tax=Selaginella moellendorffii TaxID=88036 RepID=D8R8F2_SELML|nr:hypothetical protein SELMODRAFT_408474 [Selaginella moellendorffii]
MERVRRIVFDCFGCFPGRLERIIGKVLGCCVRIQGVLGRGRYLVLDTLLVDKGRSERRVALRLPLTRRSRISPQEAVSGYAATLFLSQLGGPTVVAGPIHVASPPFRYATRGMSYLAVLPVADGVRLWDLWEDSRSTLAWRKRVLSDLAAVTLQLYRHPLKGIGDMALASDGSPCVGVLRDGAVAIAMERGMDVGDRLSPGPYSTWKEYAWNQIQGLLLLYGDSPLYGGSIRANAEIILEWLEDFQPDFPEKFFLCHPEFGSGQVLVDPGSGHVESIGDWDGAKTVTVHWLARGFFLPFFHYREKPDEEEEEELLRFFCEELRLGGAPELVPYVTKYPEEVYPQVMFEEHIRPREVSAEGANSLLWVFCTDMQAQGFMDDEMVIQKVEAPWKKSKSPITSSAQEDDEEKSGEDDEEDEDGEEESGDGEEESGEDEDEDGEGKCRTHAVETKPYQGLD